VEPTLSFGADAYRRRSLLGSRARDTRFVSVRKFDPSSVAAPPYRGPFAEERVLDRVVVLVGLERRNWRSRVCVGS
jgi:hypothetical protein